MDDIATQPHWLTPELVTAVTALIVALGAAVAGIIGALKGQEGKTTALASQRSLDRFSTRANAADERVSRIERDLPPQTAAPQRPKFPPGAVPPPSGVSSEQL